MEIQEVVEKRNCLRKYTYAIYNKKTLRCSLPEGKIINERRINEKV
jgi:hypothetical protein